MPKTNHTSQNPSLILQKIFGYDSFRPLQKEIIEKILARQDTLAVMPTGGGKSLCYQVPALIFPGLTIVVSPLIALMQDQVSFLIDAGVQALFLNSSLDWNSYRENMSRVKSGEIKLLYLAPETLVTDRVEEMLSDINVDCITIDEAHCISEWGHDFRPEYRKISNIRTMFPKAVCLALTATATAQVRTDIKKTLKLKDPAIFISSFNRENIYLKVEKKSDPLEQVISFLSNHKKECGIIYCFSRKQVDELTEYLNYKEFNAYSYHAGLNAETRAQNQEIFLKESEVIMVATLAFGMGINKIDVRYVIHYDLPKSVEQYYQEIGRAGRDGKASTALLLYSYSDTRKIRYFIEQKSEAESLKAEAHLKAITSYADGSHCRRASLLEYFGEELKNKNVASDFKCCDICNKEPLRAEDFTDLTIPVQKVLSCIIRTNERYGASYIIDILLGSKLARIIENSHNELSTYGIGKDKNKEDWFEIIKLLLESDYLIKDGEYNVLSLTQKARKALQERASIFLPYKEIKGSAGLKKSKARSKTKEYKIEPSDLKAQTILLSLKELRASIAKEAELPPYVVFSDRTIEELACLKPANKKELLTIFGIGEVKAERYGIEILKIIKEA